MTIKESERNPAPSGALQFDKAELGAGAARTCGHCRRMIDGEYFVVGKSIACPSCAQLMGGSGDSASFLRALGYGAGAALTGTVIWILVMKLSNGSEFGIIAIGVGLLVGLAVRKGARGIGGRKYQALAMTLTYVSITTSYVPIVFKAITDKGHETAEGKKAADSAGQQAPQEPPVAREEKASTGAVVLLLAMLFGVALVFPFLGGTSNIMGLFIIAIALYEAWKINRRIPVSGPFRVGAAGFSGATGPPQGAISPPR